MTTTQTTYRVRVGADGATKTATDDYGTALDACRALSDRGIGRAEVRDADGTVVRCEWGEVIYKRGVTDRRYAR